MVEHNKDLVLAKIKQYFPHEIQGKILSSLSLSGEDRIQLAVLKLSEGDLEKLHIYLEAAIGDWRDVLVG